MKRGAHAEKDRREELLHGTSPESNLAESRWTVHAHSAPNQNARQGKARQGKARKRAIRIIISGYRHLQSWLRRHILGASRRMLNHLLTPGVLLYIVCVLSC